MFRRRITFPSPTVRCESGRMVPVRLTITDRIAIWQRARSVPTQQARSGLFLRSARRGNRWARSASSSPSDRQRSTNDEYPVARPEHRISQNDQIAVPSGTGGGQPVRSATFLRFAIPKAQTRAAVGAQSDDPSLRNDPGSGQCRLNQNQREGTCQRL